jgi:hypothetical protein
MFTRRTYMNIRAERGPLTHINIDIDMRRETFGGRQEGHATFAEPRHLHLHLLLLSLVRHAHLICVFSLGIRICI